MKLVAEKLPKIGAIGGISRHLELARRQLQEDQAELARLKPRFAAQHFGGCAPRFAGFLGTAMASNIWFSLIRIGLLVLFL